MFPLYPIHIPVYYQFSWLNPHFCWCYPDIPTIFPLKEISINIPLHIPAILLAEFSVGSRNIAPTMIFPQINLPIFATPRKVRPTSYKLAIENVLL